MALDDPETDWDDDPDLKSLCKCGHTKEEHRDDFTCTICDCKDFQYKED